MKRLEDKHVDLIVLDQKIDTTTPTWKLTFNLLGVIAEFEREIINERIREWIENAKANGIQLGRRRSVTDKQLVEMKTALENGEGRSAVAKRFGVSPTSIYRYFPVSDDLDAN